MKIEISDSSKMEIRAENYADRLYLAHFIKETEIGGEFTYRRCGQGGGGNFTGDDVILEESDILEYDDNFREEFEKKGKKGVFINEIDGIDFCSYSYWIINN